MTPQVAFGICACAPKLASSFPFCLHRGVRAGRLGFLAHANLLGQSVKAIAICRHMPQGSHTRRLSP
jgi:hypothetical protein